jgi:DNA polymerase-3 subunit epsilon
VDEDVYAAVVRHLRDGIERDPEALLGPLRDRMERLAGARRFEEAAETRDRYLSLARSLSGRRAWQALNAAGTFWAEDGEGNGVVVQDGCLAAAWNTRTPLPLVAARGPAEDPPSVAGSVQAAEEAHLVWRWLDRNGVVIVQSTGTLSLPVRPIPALV